MENPLKLLQCLSKMCFKAASLSGRSFKEMRLESAYSRISMVMNV